MVINVRDASLIQNFLIISKIKNYVKNSFSRSNIIVVSYERTRPLYKPHIFI